ncbi:MAG: DUF1622 domain-containing protein [Propionibacteriales bacterium]|nr:DUF1622 domain-containing protein [Propionibacteriales bacterium]
MRTEALTGAALVIAAAAVGVGVLTMAVTRDLRVALPAFLDLLMASGLLRLALASTWEAIGSAAALVLIRKVIVFAITRSPADTAAPPSMTATTPS